jgi:hypothetical protein
MLDRSTASQEPPATAIRQIACAHDGDLFATAEFESRVETWSLANEGEHVVELEAHRSTMRQGGSLGHDLGHAYGGRVPGGRSRFMTRSRDG